MPMIWPACWWIPCRIASALSRRRSAFITALRNWTQKHGALLVFDEVITYRSSYGGAQEWFNVQPDLTALGKMIGGGFPVGAIAGRERSHGGF